MHSFRNRLFLALWISCLAFFFLWFWLPGVLVFDVVAILSQFMRSHYSDWLSPAVSVLWGPLVYFNLGVSSILVFHVALFSIALLLLLLSLNIRLIYAGIISLLLFLSPSVFFSLSLVSRDATFAVFLLLASSLLLLSSTERNPPVLQILACVVLTLAVFCRQEGIVVCAPFVFWYMVRGNRNLFNGRLAAIGLAVCFLVAISIVQFLLHRGVLNVFPANPERYFIVRDLTSLTRASDDCPVCELRRDECAQEDLIALVRRPWHRTMEWYEWHDSIRECLDEDDVSKMYRLWFAAVSARPLLFASLRLEGMHLRLMRPLRLNRYFGPKKFSVNNIFTPDDVASLPSGFLRDTYLSLDAVRRNMLTRILWGGVEELVSAYPYVVAHCFLLMLLIAKRSSPASPVFVSFGIAVSVSALLQLLVLLLVGAGGAFRNYTWILISSGVSLIIYLRECRSLRLFETLPCPSAAVNASFSAVEGSSE